MIRGRLVFRAMLPALGEGATIYCDRVDRVSSKACSYGLHFLDAWQLIDRRYLSAHIALFVIRKGELIERNFIPNRVGQGGVALVLGCL